MAILPPKKILLGLQEGDCNLSCPKCYTHGENSPTSNERKSGVMDYEKFISLCEELSVFSPRVTPQTWDEPLLTPNLFKYLKILKDFKLTVTMDTNGILLSKKVAKQLVDLQIDSVFISLDAVTTETYLKVRGKDTLALIEKNVLGLIEARGSSLLPRIGVSFVVEDNNEHEELLFCEKWKGVADVVRVNKEFSSERQVKTDSLVERTPCWSLYDSMMVNFDGSVSLCCVDTHSEVEIGNVFEEKILDIWQRGSFSKIRKIHEEARYSEVSICSTCNLWSNEKPQVLEDERFITSKTQTHYYINAKDKIKSLPATNRYIKV